VLLTVQPPSSIENGTEKVLHPETAAMANSSVESDDAFSRRLQAQEMGIMQPHSGIDAQTPLMVDGRVCYETSCIPVKLQTSNHLQITDLLLYAQ
jgi:hypothetical protein